MGILVEHAIPLRDCTAQGYYDAVSMTEKYKGAKKNLTYIFQWQSFLLVAAMLSISVETMLPSDHRRQSHILAQFKQYITCSALARNDGNTKDTHILLSTWHVKNQVVC